MRVSYRVRPRLQRRGCDVAKYIHIGHLRHIRHLGGAPFCDSRGYLKPERLTSYWRSAPPFQKMTVVVISGLISE